MRRVRVGVFFQGVNQFYQREAEVRDNKTGKYVVKPFFVVDKRQAVVFSEEVGLALVQRLRALRVDPFLEDVSNERRIEVAHESQQPQFGATLLSVRATLDDDQMIASNEARWYTVTPIDRPDGAGQWFIKCTPPGFPNAQIVYGKDPVSCLQRAADIDILRFAELAPPQETPQPVQHNSRVGFRRRIGDLR